MGIFDSIFKRSKEATVAMTIVDSDTAEEYATASLIDDLFDRKLQGFIQRRFLSEEECARLVHNFYAEVGYDKDPEKTVIYPPNFYQIRNENVDEKYFQLAREYKEQFPEKYGVDVHQRLFDYLLNLHPALKIKIPPGEAGGYYQPTTFRSLPPNDIVMYAHCENQLRELFDEHCQYLASMTDIYDSLSFFIVLQAPEKGGRLILYDVEWDQGKKNPQTRSNTIQLDTGEEVDLDAKNASIGNLKIDLKVGDMIMFPGGQLWHSVEAVGGKKNRVTFGGFLSKGREEEWTLYVWS